MRLLRTVVAVACGVVLAAPLAGQGAPAAPASRETMLAAAREIMLAVPFSTLITIGPDGQPQARVVDSVAPDSAFVIWVGTSRLTRKVADITRDRRVTIMYANPAGQEYVTVIGTAVIDDDLAHKAAHWKPSWGMMSKDGYRGADFVLIRVQPSRLEISSVKRGVFNDPTNWLPAVVTLP
jgi:general stress protein 26